MSSHFTACSRRDALSQNGNGHSGIPRHLQTNSCIHPSGGIVGELWECEPFRYQQWQLLLDRASQVSCLRVSCRLISDPIVSPHFSDRLAALCMTAMGVKAGSALAPCSLRFVFQIRHVFVCAKSLLESEPELSIGHGELRVHGPCMHPIAEVAGFSWKGSSPSVTIIRRPRMSGRRMSGTSQAFCPDRF